MSTVEVFSQDIVMEFSIKKCVVIIMYTGKVKSPDRVELPSGKGCRGAKLILMSKLNGRNTIITLNTWAVSQLGIRINYKRWAEKPRNL